MADDDFGFALPAFKPDEALQRARRDLRELGLAERNGQFERAGVAIAKLAVDGAALKASVVKRPSRSSPNGHTRPCRTAPSCATGPPS